MESAGISDILVVDDSKAARKIVRRCLRALGHHEAEFREAADGAEALESIREKLPDLIVTDLNMPVMDGVTMLRKIKASPRLQGVPIVVVSSILDDQRRSRLRERGVEYLVEKPLDPAALREVLDRIAEETSA
jgi:CheY-like chemotaxis protein